jgi:hypothetical protein
MSGGYFDMRSKKYSNSQLRGISRWKAAASAVRRAGPHGAWPKKIRKRAARLMRSGVSAYELKKQAGISAQTLHAWKNDLSGKGKKRSGKSRASWRELRVVDRTEKIKIKSAAQCGVLSVRLMGGAEIAGVSVEQIETWLKRGVL